MIKLGSWLWERKTTKVMYPSCPMSRKQGTGTYPTSWKYHPLSLGQTTMGVGGASPLQVTVPPHPLLLLLCSLEMGRWDRHTLKEESMGPKLRFLGRHSQSVMAVLLSKDWFLIYICTCSIIYISPMCLSGSSREIGRIHTDTHAHTRHIHAKHIHAHMWSSLHICEEIGFRTYRGNERLQILKSNIKWCICL